MHVPVCRLSGGHADLLVVGEAPGHGLGAADVGLEGLVLDVGDDAAVFHAGAVALLVDAHSALGIIFLHGGINEDLKMSVNLISCLYETIRSVKN